MLLETTESPEGQGGRLDSPFVHLESFSQTEGLALDCVEVLSEARHVEVYGEGEEYLGTAVGVVSAEGK